MVIDTNTLLLQHADVLSILTGRKWVVMGTGKDSFAHGCDGILYQKDDDFGPFVMVIKRPTPHDEHGWEWVLSSDRGDTFQVGSDTFYGLLCKPGVRTFLEFGDGCGLQNAFCHPNKQRDHLARIERRREEDRLKGKSVSFKLFGRQFTFNWAPLK